MLPVCHISSSVRVKIKLCLIFVQTVKRVEELNNLCTGYINKQNISLMFFRESSFNHSKNLYLFRFLERSVLLSQCWAIH